jgi:hypothetical protein
MVYAECATGMEIIFSIPMVNLGDVCQVEPHFGARFCAECTIGSKIILDTPNGTPRWVKWNLVLVRLGIVSISKQDRCTVCAEHTIGSENHFGRI